MLFRSYTHKFQQNLIQQIQSTQNLSAPEQTTKKNILQKINSYKKQDNLHSRFDKSQFITYDYVIELLLNCNLYCEYCKSEIFILYKNTCNEYQWTVDRIDNNIGHNINNCVISCLKCNLQKRTKDHLLFQKTRKITINKKE